jgi:hypothetical protein
MKKIYSGWARECEYGFITLNEDRDNWYGVSLADKISEDWETGDVVAVRYYVADAPMTEEEAVERLVSTIYGGGIDVEYELDAYSEYTVFEMRESLKIGGHDLAAELRTHEGKYIVLVIDNLELDGD